MKKREEQRVQKAIADADERDRLLSEILRDKLAETRDRIRAVVELNKCSGRHSVTLHHRARTLEDILSESREPKMKSGRAEAAAAEHLH